MTTIDFPEWVKPGALYEYDFGPVYGHNNSNQGRRFEIRAFVDGRAVVREWHPESNLWTYTVEGLGHFIALVALGDFRIIRDQGAAQ
ncbi:hypothetical protein ACC684_28580 [Rhizobium ruizarguesonis]